MNAGHRKRQVSPIQSWLPGASKRLARTRIFDVIEQRWTSASDANRSGSFVRLECPDWVNVVALTQDENVLLIEQFRHGYGEVTLEIPGGVLDADEDPADAAIRELREETGYAGSKPKLLGCVTPNPAFQNNRCHMYLVEDARRAGEQQLDEREEIAVIEYPLASVTSLIQQGKISHALVVSAFGFLSLERGFRF